MFTLPINNLDFIWCVLNLTMFFEKILHYWWYLLGIKDEKISSEVMNYLEKREDNYISVLVVLKIPYSDINPSDLYTDVYQIHLGEKISTDKRNAAIIYGLGRDIINFVHDTDWISDVTHRLPSELLFTYTKEMM